MPCQCDIPKPVLAEGVKYPRCEICGEHVMPVEFGGRDRTPKPPEDPAEFEATRDRAEENAMRAAERKKKNP